MSEEFPVECPDCSGTGAAIDREHPDCPDCSCIVDCRRCSGTGMVMVEEAE